MAKVQKKWRYKRKLYYICRPVYGLRDFPERSCLRSLMDRISDSGSDGCGSIPHGGTCFMNNALIFQCVIFLFAVPYAGPVAMSVPDLVGNKESLVTFAPGISGM